MTARSLRFFVEVCAGLLAGLFILIAAAVWKLSSGPVELDFITPSLEEALNSQDTPFTFDVGTTVLTWGGWDRAVDIVAQDVMISPRQKGHAPVAVLPEISVGFSLKALREGTIAPTMLEFLHPKFSLKRNHLGDWGIVMDVGQGEVAPADDGKGLMDLLTGFSSAGAAEDQGRFGYLNHITFADALVTIDDQKTGRKWDASIAKLDIERTGFGVALEFDGLLQLDGISVDLSLIATKDFGEDIFHVTFDSPYMDPAILSGFFPDVALLSTELPKLVTSGDADIGEDGWPRAANLLVSSEAGGLSVKLGQVSGDPSGSGERHYRAGLTLEGAQLGLWGAYLPEELRKADILAKADATAEIEFSVNGHSQNVTFGDVGISLAMDPGTVAVPSLYHEALQFDALRMSAAISDSGRHVVLETLEIDLPDGALSANAHIVQTETGRSVELDGKLTDFNFASLDKYWPENLGSDARAWVVPNIPEAFVPEATISIAGLLGDEGTFELTRMGGEILMQDSVVDYLNPLPPARGVSGRAVFDESTFDIDVATGHVGNLHLTGGKINILGIGVDETIDINLQIKGPFRETLELVDHEPLKLVSGIGFDPATVNADAVGAVRLAFPLINDLEAKSINVTASAKLTNLKMEDAFQGRPVQGQDLEMAVDNDGFEIAGDVVLEETPLRVTWKERFGDDETLRKELTASGQVDEHLLKKFGHTVAPVIEGPAQVKLISQEFRDGSQKLLLDADLTDSGMVIAPLNWMKPRTFPASLSLIMLLEDGQPVRLNKIRFKDETLETDFDMVLSEDMSVIQSVDMKEMVLDGGRTTGKLSLTEKGAYEVVLEGDRFDLTGIIDQALGELELEKLSEEQQASTPFSIRATFTELTAIPKRRLGPSSLEIRHDGQNVRRFHLSSVLDDLSELEIDYGPEGGGYRLLATADNAGTAFRNLNLFDRIEGGNLKVTGHRVSADEPLVGHVEMDEYTLVKAPVMAKVLEFMSLTGILTSLTDKGLPFSRFEADYSLDEAVLSFAKARAFSPSIGISIKGSYNLDEDRIDAKGTVAPAYAINRVLNIIPVVGWLLTGGEDSGFLGANYEVSGPMDKPEITVNPLSALAPGALRKIFDIFPDGESSAPGEGSKSGGN
ncbi:AsmA-like C-terminal domain-containing protein [Aestuariispira insulae]|uniref:AsmA-like protein n=1 Tax=Aestuariispira insulae TaxID=1461337 RepID=A0A3D9HW56_9PROT|nr:AsmA-like C-terminal domain-containing protein [Aestuariispira insulae]RED53649.1 AsmA-like protein [Aestuariispira insulae]